jgi:hypothetical protein
MNLNNVHTHYEKSGCGIGADLAVEGGYLGGPLKADRE